MEKFEDVLEELREEMYNQVIQDHSELGYKYYGDELQDKINEIVDIELKKRYDV